MSASTTSTYSLHVLYKHSSHPLVLILALGAGAFLFFWYHWRPSPAHRSKFPSGASSSAQVEIETGPSDPKKRTRTQERREKRRLAKEAEEALAASRAQEEAESSNSPPTLTTSLRTEEESVTQQHSHGHPTLPSQSEFEVWTSIPIDFLCFVLTLSDVSPYVQSAVQSDVPQQRVASPSPRPPSPSPSETTTATSTTTVTVQSSTLVLTPPSTILPTLLLPADKDTPHEHDQERLLAGSEDDDAIRPEAVRAPTDKSEEPEPSQGLQLHPKGTSSRSESPAPFERPTNKSQRKSSTKTITPKPDIPPPTQTQPTSKVDDESTPVVTRSSPQTPDALSQAEKPDHADSPATTPAVIPPLTPAEGHQLPARPRLPASSGSSGGVGLGLPSSPVRGLRPSPSASPSRIQSSPLSPLPPRHRRRLHNYKEQPGQPPQSAFPNRSPVTSPIPTSPMMFSFAGPSTQPQWYPGTPPQVGYPRFQQQPPIPHAYAPILHATPPMGYDVPRFASQHARSQSASDSSFPSVTSTSSVLAAATPEEGSGARKGMVVGSGSDQSDMDRGEGSSDSDSAQAAIDFPTLNPTPSKSPRKRRSSSKTRSDITSGAITEEPLPLGPNAPWSDPNYASYGSAPPPLIAYPFPYDPSPSHPHFRPYGYSIPTTPTQPVASGSRNPSPAWIPMSLPNGTSRTGKILSADGTDEALANLSDAKDAKDDGLETKDDKVIPFYLALNSSH